MVWSNESREKAILTKRKNGYTNQYTKAKLENKPVPENPNKGGIGHFKGKTHSNEAKQKIKIKALASSHRRLRKNTIIYKGVMLDSTWELELAKSLDENNIKWIRPKPIQWEDSKNVKHNYFPDFYLSEYDIFVDPKNPHAYNIQKDKIDILKIQIKNLIFLRSMKEIKEFALMVKGKSHGSSKPRV